jgi:quinol monooxygenase YgiN
MIHAIAAIKAREGERDNLVAAFREILPEVRAKTGCLEYSLALHLRTGFPGQPPFDENEFIIVEKWDDLESLKAHMADPKYQAWFVKLWPLVAGASMQVFQALD